MRAVSREHQLLKPANTLIERFVRDASGLSRQEARFQLLEAVASRFGGFDLHEYRAAFNVRPAVDLSALLQSAREVVESLEQTEIPASLAVSALAREALQKTEQRRSGAYHTDFRLARHLATLIGPKYRQGLTVIDPACGAGILLCALTIEACGADRKLTNAWLAKSVFAADLSENALRGTLIALSCHTNSVRVLVQMRERWRAQDSLLAGPEAWLGETNGFDIVVANPPWEKVKLTRHEFLQSQGFKRHYGEVYTSFDQSKYASEKSRADVYGEELLKRYTSLSVGEPDLYVAFTELLLGLTKPDGSCGALLPAGLIRSQSTQVARRMIADQSSHVLFEVIENRARFFEIDSRFKFLSVVARKASHASRTEAIEIGHAEGTANGVQSNPRVKLGRSVLSRLRPDLSIPEVKSTEEWKLYLKLAESGVEWSAQNSPWYPHFMREVDMTRDRPLFQTSKSRTTLPLVEGRMVHQHRFGVKSYKSGSGRAAVWAINPAGSRRIEPQFWVRADRLSRKVRERSAVMRVGFCDITGQTNERSCLASMIPPGVVCGNKVPTILFPNDPSEERLWLWLGIVNSLPFDWMIRRVITTTINYFHLLSVPLPRLSPDSLPGRKLIDISKGLYALDAGKLSSHVISEVADLRAKADAIVLNAYGLTLHDLDVMMEDFPLVDRGQPSLYGEAKSTITHDLIASYLPKGSSQSKSRVKEATALGAVAYVPGQMAGISDAETDEQKHG